MTLTEAREALAAALSAVDGVTVQARPDARAPLAGQGWVNVSRIIPAAFTAAMVTLTAVVILGPEQAAAEALLDDLAVPLIDAAVGSELLTADVSLLPELLVAGTTASPVYAVAITLTTEI